MPGINNMNEVPIANTMIIRPNINSIEVYFKSPSWRSNYLLNHQARRVKLKGGFYFINNFLTV